MKAVDPFLMFADSLRLHGLETTANRWYSAYQATVISLDDPMGLGRVKVNVPALSDLTSPEYAIPITPFGGLNCGFFFPPRIGDQGYVLFEFGNHRYPLFLGGGWAAPLNVSQVPDDALRPTLPLLPPPPGLVATPEYTTRVLKTPMGMLLRFEDGDAAGARDKGLELTTAIATKAGGPFTKLHSLVMSDTQKLIELHTAGIPVGSLRYRLVLNDAQKTAFLQSGTGQLVALEDAPNLQRIRLLTPAGNLLLLDDKNKVMRLDSINSNIIEIDDKTNKITAKTIGNRSIVLDDGSQTMTVTDPLGNIVTMGPTGIQITSASMVNTQAPGAITTVAGGAVATTGAGIAQTSLGGAPMATLNTGLTTGLMLGGLLSTIIGIVAVTLLGGLTLGIAGAALITASTLSVVSSSIALGDPGSAQQLVNVQILTWLATHTHPTAALGPPSPPVQAAQLSGPLAQVYLTQNVTAS